MEGDWEQVEEQWQRIYSEWLPSSTYKLAEGGLNIAETSLMRKIPE